MSRLTSTPSSTISPTASSGEVAANTSGAATQREAEADGGLQRRAGRHREAGGEQRGAHAVRAVAGDGMAHIVAIAVGAARRPGGAQPARNVTTARTRR